MAVSTPPPQQQQQQPSQTDAPPPSADTPIGAFRAAVVAPTFNNASTLIDILDRITAAAPEVPLIVVDDGSTDDTAEVLRERTARKANWTVVAHDQNRGKAAALRTGFEEAGRLGCTHAVTIDTDGQLDPEQIPDLIAAARENPTALVIGNRDDQAADYPSRSRVGRRISNLLIRLESGVPVEDSQCGFRVYPLGLVNAVNVRAGRYGFEAEIITRAGWAGCPLVHVPVRCRYLAPAERVSHFRPWLDSFRGAGMHLRLLGRALLPIPYKKWPPKAPKPAGDGPAWRRLLKWVSPAEVVRQLRRDRVGRTELSTGLAVGAFIANLPLYPVQTLFSIYAARKLHLHPLAVVLGSQLSTPPIGPLLVVGGIIVGHVILHGTWPTPDSYHFTLDFEGFHRLFRSMFFEWLLGGVILGAVAGALTFAVASAAIRLIAGPVRR